LSANKFQLKFAAQHQFATIAARQQLHALVCSAASSAESAASVLATIAVADATAVARPAVQAVAVANQVSRQLKSRYYSTLASDRYENLPLVPV
jgi:hypothetical protein